MSGVPSVKTRRAPTASARPCSFAATWARTTPATVLRSATPRPESPSSLARATSSSGCEAPRRKEKLVVTASSAYAVMTCQTKKNVYIYTHDNTAFHRPMVATAGIESKLCGRVSRPRSKRWPHGTKQPQADPDVGEGWLGSGSRERGSPHVQASGSGAAHNGHAPTQGSADRARATDLQACGMATMMVANADQTATRNHCDGKRCEHDDPVCSDRREGPR